MTIQCNFCSKDINPHDLGVWKQVTGWVGGPRKDSMTLRYDTGKYACTQCVEKLKAGQAFDQPDLLGESDDKLMERFHALAEASSEEEELLKKVDEPKSTSATLNDILGRKE